MAFVGVLSTEIMKKICFCWGLCHLRIYVYGMRVGKFLVICSLLGAVSTWAIKAAPFLINSTQPDGSVVQIRKVGNERFNYTITGEDSVLVVRDSSGYWNYADEHGKKTGMRVHAKSKRSAKEKNFLKKRNSREILEKFRENRIKQLQEQSESEPQVLRSVQPQMAAQNAREKVPIPQLARFRLFPLKKKVIFAELSFLSSLAM